MNWHLPDQCLRGQVWFSKLELVFKSLSTLPTQPHAETRGLSIKCLLTLATTQSSVGQWMELVLCHLPEGVSRHGHPHPLWGLLAWTREPQTLEVFV